MIKIRDFFEEEGFEVLSVSKNKKGELIVRTVRGEFNVGRNMFPVSFTEERIKQILSASLS